MKNRNKKEYLYEEKWNGKGYDEYGNIIYVLKKKMEKQKNMIMMVIQNMKMNIKMEKYMEKNMIMKVNKNMKVII